MATVVRENIGLLHDKLMVKLNKEDYLPAFEKKLKEYSKTANIPGFRKGMVPAGMIKKMYGAGIFSDEVLRTIEKELYTYLDAEKPEIFAQPLPMDNEMKPLDMNNPTDVEFAFEIGLKPAFTLNDLSKASFTRNKVAVTPAMVDEEITRMQQKAGKMEEKEAIENNDNVINILLAEADENGVEIEAGIVKETSIAVKDCSAAMQQQLLGKKVGDSFINTLDKAFEGESLTAIAQTIGLAKEDAANKFFKITIKTIGVVVPATLDEAFFNEVYPGKEIKTLEALKEALQTEIEQYWAAQTRNQLHDQLYHFLLDETKMEFPQAFLTRWLKTGGDKQRTQEEAEKEYPTFENQLKWTLISDTIIRDNKLEVTEEDLRASMKEEVTRYFGQMNMGGDLSWLDSYLDRMMKDEKQVDATYRRVVTEKLFDWAEKQTNPTEKLVTVDELVAMQHNHQH
ncbi:trigger factor [Ferruginibacter yonginensis]|uniref:Trigger factor n=1 Tax=Ferruginibacter yonginensis TaxID=1310416 RepID=A0ABV8QU72_9BACT